MNTETGRTLIAIARNAIAQRLGLETPASAFDADWLRTKGATYVTLLREGKLRGSTGTLQAHRTIAEDVMANAVAAACNDLRFTPLTGDEFPQTRIEICVLSAVEPLAAADEAVVVSQLRPGIDGAIFEYGRHRSHFLPQMWDQSANPQEFLAQLKYKAGLPPDFWSKDVKVARYTTSLWREADLNR